MYNRYVTELAFGMFLSLQGSYEFVHYIVYVAEAKGDVGVVDLDGEVVGYVVAESGYGTVVVGSAPLAKEVWEAVDEYLGSGYYSIVEHELFADSFAFSVGVVQFCLDGAAYHDWTGVAVFLQGIEQQGCKTEVALHELFLVLRSVDTCQVEDEIGFGTKLIKFFLGIA